MSFNTTLKPRAVQNTDTGGQNQEMLLLFLYYDQYIWFRAKRINDLSSQQLETESPVFNYISKHSWSDLKSTIMLSQTVALYKIPLPLTSDSYVSSATVFHSLQFFYWYVSRAKYRTELLKYWAISSAISNTESRKVLIKKRKKKKDFLFSLIFF